MSSMLFLLLFGPFSYLPFSIVLFFLPCLRDFEMWTSVAFSLLAVTSSLAYPAHQQCRCRPHEPCWPSEQQWQSLNSSIDGNLQAIRPIASVCHDPTYDHEACQEVTAMTHDSAWRSSQPGAHKPPFAWRMETAFSSWTYSN